MSAILVLAADGKSLNQMAQTRADGRRSAILHSISTMAVTNSYGRNHGGPGARLSLVSEDTTVGGGALPLAIAGCSEFEGCRRHIGERRDPCVSKRFTAARMLEKHLESRRVETSTPIEEHMNQRPRARIVRCALLNVGELGMRDACGQ